MIYGDRVLFLIVAAVTNQEVLTATGEKNDQSTYINYSNITLYSLNGRCDGAHSKNKGVWCLGEGGAA